MSSNRTTPPSLAGRVAVVHAAGLMIFLTWRFGGMDDFGRSVATWALLPAPLLTFLAWREAGGARRRSFAFIAIPLLLFTLLVVISLFNPSMRFLQFWGADSLVPQPHTSWLPSTPFPSGTRDDFLLNLGLVVASLNLMLGRAPRQWLRSLLAIVAINTAVLAAVGTLFKLSGATEILGRTPSPNPNFFATFVYHNHWGALAILGAGAAMALAFHFHHQSRLPLVRTSVPCWLLAAGIILLSVPLSSGRASTVAAVVYLGISGMLTMWRAIRHKGRGAAGARRLAGRFALAGFAAVVAVLMLAESTLRREVDQTAQQIAELRSGGIGDARVVIYQDTLRLIRERPVFGWGWNSFRHVFPRVQSPLPKMQTNQSQLHVVDAHNDWLQLLAEMGLAGAALLLAALWGTVRWALPGGWIYAAPRELAIALGTIALLALVDFPSASPAVVATAACLAACGAELGRQHSRQHATRPSPTANQGNPS